MIFNPIFVAGRVKNVVLNPSYVTVKYDTQTDYQTTITITYDPERQKNTCFIIAWAMPNGTNDDLVIVVFPGEERATWESDYPGSFFHSFTMSKESDNTFKLFMTHDSVHRSICTYRLRNVGRKNSFSRRRRDAGGVK